MNIDHQGNMDFVAHHTIVTETVRYEPWSDGHAIGYRVTRLADGKVGYVYFNASVDDGFDPECGPDVFVYMGPVGDPAQDGAAHHYNIDGDVFGDAPGTLAGNDTQHGRT